MDPLLIGIDAPTRSADDVGLRLFVVNPSDTPLAVGCTRSFMQTVDEEVGTMVRRDFDPDRVEIPPGAAVEVDGVRGWEWDGVVEIVLSYTLPGEWPVRRRHLLRDVRRCVVPVLDVEGYVIPPSDEDGLVAHFARGERIESFAGEFDANTDQVRRWLKVALARRGRLDDDALRRLGEPPTAGARG